MTVYIATTDGRRQVETKQKPIGCWAIHRPLEGRKWWVVTHIPTGYAITVGLKLRQARRLAQLLHETFSELGTKGTVAAVSRYMTKTRRQLCEELKWQACV